MKAKKLLAISVIMIMIFALTACSVTVDDRVEADGFSVGVPKDWYSKYSKNSNTVTISQEKDDWTKHQIVVTLTDTKQSKDEIQKTFKGMMKHGFEDLGTCEIGGVECLVVGFLAGEMYAKWYGGNIVDGKEISIQVVNEEDEKYTKAILESIEF